MPKYLSEVYDPFTHTDKVVQLEIECPYYVIEHLPPDGLSELVKAAYSRPEKGFAITFKVLKPSAGKKRKQ